MRRIGRFEWLNPCLLDEQILKDRLHRVHVRRPHPVVVVDHKLAAVDGPAVMQQRGKELVPKEGVGALGVWARRGLSTGTAAAVSRGAAVGSRRACTPVANVEVGERVEAVCLVTPVPRLNHVEGGVVVAQPAVDRAQIGPFLLVGQEEAVVWHKGATEVPVGFESERACARGVDAVKVGGVGSEALKVGRPLIANRRHEEGREGADEEGESWAKAASVADQVSREASREASRVAEAQKLSLKAETAWRCMERELGNDVGRVQGQRHARVRGLVQQQRRDR